MPCFLAQRVHNLDKESVECVKCRRMGPIVSSKQAQEGARRLQSRALMSSVFFRSLATSLWLLGIPDLSVLQYQHIIGCKCILKQEKQTAGDGDETYDPGLQQAHSFTL